MLFKRFVFFLPLENFPPLVTKLNNHNQCVRVRVSVSLIEEETEKYSESKIYNKM